MLARLCYLTQSELSTQTVTRHSIEISHHQNEDIVFNKDKNFSIFTQILFSGLCLNTSGKLGERKGAAENFSQGFPDGEHDTQEDESQLLPHGALTFPI